MKLLYTLIFLLFSNFSFAQNLTYGLLEVSTNNYSVVSIDPVSGLHTTVGAVPGMNAFVSPDKTTLDSTNNWYIFTGHDGANSNLYVMDLTTGTIVHNNVFNENVVGLEYHCESHKFYGLREAANLYDLVEVDPATGSVTSISNVPTISAYVGGSFTLDFKRDLYNFKALNSTNFLLYSLDINTGTIVHNNGFSDNVASMEYNCMDSTIYGLWEDGNDYKWVSVDPATGTHSTVATLLGVTPGYFSDTHTMNGQGEYTYRGFIGSSFKHFTIEASTGAILNSPSFTSNVVGMEAYPCCAEIITGPLPGVDFIGNPLIVPVGGNVNFNDLSTENPTSWTWNFQGATPATSNQQHPTGIVYDTIGCYDVQLIANNAFGADSLTKTCYVEVYDPNGVEEAANFGPKVVVYPNPSEHEVTFEIKESNATFQLELFDVSGRRIVEKQVVKGKFTLTRNGWDAGIYYYTLQSETQFASGKITFR